MHDCTGLCTKLKVQCQRKIQNRPVYRCTLYFNDPRAEVAIERINEVLNAEIQIW